MISTNEKLAKKQRKILGPLGRLLLKVFSWEIKGKLPDLEKMILIGIPHTAMRDAWYALLAVWALDLKVNFLEQLGYLRGFQVYLLYLKI